MARVTGEDAAAGLPDEMVARGGRRAGAVRPLARRRCPTAERIEWARRAEEAALAFSPEIDNSSGASFSAGEDTRGAREQRRASSARYRTSSGLVLVVPVAAARRPDAARLLVHAGRGLGDLLPPEEVGRIAARAHACGGWARAGADLRGAGRVRPGDGGGADGPPLPRACPATPCSATRPSSRTAWARRWLRRCSRWWTRDGGRAGWARGRSTARGCPRGATCRSSAACCGTFLCDSYAARKIGGTADRRRAPRRRRAAPSVGASNLYFEAGATPPEQIVGEVDRGLLRHGPHRLRRGPRVGRLLAGRRRPLDREGPAGPPRPRGHDRRQPEADADGRGRGGLRPRCSAARPRRPRCASGR